MTIIENEIWADIPNYEGIYQASNLGRVKSLDRISGEKRPRRIKEKILAVYYCTNGYQFHILSKDGKPRDRLTHRLVASAFYGVSDLVVDHLDGDKKNNHIDNLEYVTQRENSCRGNKCDKKEGKSSEYRGVVLDDGAWHARKRIDGKFTYLGRYKNEIDASEAYLLGRKTEKANTPKEPKGYFRLECKNMWIVQVRIDGKKTRIGSFIHEEDAKIIADKYLKEAQ